MPDQQDGLLSGFIDSATGRTSSVFVDWATCWTTEWI